MTMDERGVILFWIGIVMFTYDGLGHFCCFLARVTGNYGAYLWNNYSNYIWPSLQNSIAYDLFWSVFFGVAITLIITGYYKKTTRGVNIDLYNLNQPINMECSCGVNKLYPTDYLSQSQPNYKCQECGKEYHIAPESKLEIISDKEKYE